MLWFVFALLSAVFMTAYTLSIRIFLKDKGDPYAFTFITTVFGGVILLVLVPFETIRFIFNVQTAISLLILAVLFGVTDLVFIKARQQEEISVISLVGQLGSVWNLFGGLLLFHESLTFSKILGIGLILGGNVLVLWNNQKIRFTQGVKLATLGTFLFSVGTFADKYFSTFFSPSFYKGMLFIMESIVLFLFFLPGRWKAANKEYKLQGWKIILIGPCLSLALFFLTKSFQVGGEASKVMPIFSLALIMGVVLGIFLLKEKSNMLKKFIALILVLVGTYILQAF